MSSVDLWLIAGAAALTLAVWALTRFEARRDAQAARPRARDLEIAVAAYRARDARHLPDDVQ